MILLELRLLAPGQPEQHVEIIAHHRRLGAHRRHRLELLELGGRLGARFLRELERRDLLGQLGDLVAIAFLALIAQLALDRLQLLVEIIFALGLLHLALTRGCDLLLDLQDAELALHEGEHHLEPLRGVGLDQQRLLVGDLDRDVGGDRIGEARGLLDLAELHRGLGGQLAVELGIILELIDHRAHQRLELGAQILGVLLLTFSPNSAPALSSCVSPSSTGLTVAVRKAPIRRPSRAWRAPCPRPARARCRREA